MALVTIKVSRHTRHMYRVLAAHLNTTIHQAVSDAAWVQLKKHKLKIPPAATDAPKTTARNGRKESRK